jgi:hypothetical protein
MRLTIHEQSYPAFKHEINILSIISKRKLNIQKLINAMINKTLSLISK